MTATESLFFGTINDFRNKIGTKRTYQHDLLFVRFRGEADMDDRVASTASVVNDPKRTLSVEGEFSGV